MSAFVSWVMSILAIVVLGTVLDMFLSEKKLGKMVRGVFASLLVLVIISPLPSLLNGCEGTANGFLPGEITLDSKYLDYANSAKTSALQSGLAKALKDEGYSGIVATVTADFSDGIDIRQVRLDISRLVVEKATLNINKTENIRGKAAEYLKISKDLIFIIG